MTSSWPFGEGNLPVIDGFPKERPVIRVCTVEQAVDLPVIWGAVTLIQHYNVWHVSH